MQILEITKSKEFKELHECGLIDETALRNMFIRAEYRKRVAAGENLKKREIKQQLAEEYNLGRKAISNILYGHKNKKKQFGELNNEGR